MNAKEFEEYTAELLRSMGFKDVKRVGRTADRGVDVEAYQEDAFGFKTKYIVQCKFYEEGLVSSPEMQKFCGAMSIHEASRGIFVTSSTFTAEAQEIASLHNITLIDGLQLNNLIKKYDLEAIRQISDVEFITQKDTLTYVDIYKSLSFGKRSGQPFIIPNVEPLALIEGLSLYLENIATINLNEIQITDARIEIRGLFVVHWSVDKIWHDSQGKVRSSWSGKGVYATDEQGNEIYDVGDERNHLVRSPLVEYIYLAEHKNWKEISRKFKVIMPKIKRVAYKRLIKISGIPSNDIHCEADKYYITTKIIIEYRYRGKHCSFIYDCISNTIENNLPVYTKDEIRRLAVREKPELEMMDFSLELEDDVWEITSTDLLMKIHKYSGKVMNQKTPAEIIMDQTLKEATKIFEDAKYDKNIVLRIAIGEDCKSHWELSYNSKNGKLFFISKISGKLTYKKQINENYALELAQKENLNNSELLGMKRDKKGYTFHFLDKKYDWELYIDTQGKIILSSQLLTWREATSRASQYLENDGVEAPKLMTAEEEKNLESYTLLYISELDGEFNVTISNTPSNYSCDITSQKIKDHRAQYLAARTSYGEVVSIKRRYWGLSNSWNAVIIDESGNKKKIRIQGDGIIK